MHILKRVIKSILALLAILIVLGGIGAIALAKWVNPNSFKPQIVQMVDAATGRHLTLTGDLSWNFFPRLGIHVGEAALSNPASFTQVDFAEMNAADLYLSTSALFHGKIAVKSFNIDGLQLFLRQNAHQNNWTFTPATQVITPAQAKTKTVQTNHSVAFSVESFTLSNAQLSYDNDQTKSHMTFSNLNVKISQFDFANAFPVSLSGDVDVNDSLTGAVKLSALAQVNMDKKTLSLKTLAAGGQFSYLTNASQSINLSTHISGQVDVDLNQQQLNFTGVHFDLNQILDGTFNLNVKNWTALNYSGNINLTPFALPDLAASLGVMLPAFPNQAILNQVSASSQFVGHAQKLTLNPVNVSFAGTHIQGSVNISSFKPLRLAESLTADQFDLSNFMSLYGAKLPMQNLAVSGTVKNEGSLSLNQNLLVQSVILQGFDLRAMIDQLNQIASNLLDIRNLIDASAQINKAMGVLKNSQAPLNAGNGEHTDLGVLKANLVLHQGIVTTPVMNMKGPLVVINGSGQIDLNQKTIDYTLVSRLVLPGQIKGLVIPYKLSGPFAQMQQGVEWPIVQAEIVKYITVALGSTVTHSVDSVVGGAVNALKGLFNRGSQ